jgi:putative peptidoglycan lipid II flippase
MSSKRILRAVSIVSLGTIVARLFGLAREISTANFFGTTSIYDAFLIAFMIPNFFRGLLAEGALNTAFIPVFTEYASEGADKKEGMEIFNICFTVSLITTVTLFLLVLLISFISRGLMTESSRWWQVWTLLRFTFPYLIFISLTALNMGVLNAYKNFFLPSLSPVILDAVWIAGLFLLLPLFGNTPEKQIFGLCTAVFLGGMGQFLLTLIPVLRKGYKIRLNFRFAHPVIKKMSRLLAPVVIGVAVTPINLLADYSLANLLYKGAVSGLWYSTRIFQLPLGVFAISISTVVLPWFSEDASLKNDEGFIKNLRFSMKLLTILLLPFTFGLIVFSDEIVSFLFARGMFGLESVSLVSSPLIFYSIGLLGYGGASVWSRAFYACKDTSTPVKVGIFSIVINLVLNLVFMRLIGHSGIALSTSLVGMTNFILLVIIFNKKHIYVDLKTMIPLLTKIFVSALFMGAVLFLYKNAFKNLFSLPILLFTGIIIAVGVYLFCLRLFSSHLKED